MQTMKSQTGQMGKPLPEEEGEPQEEQMMEPGNSDDAVINGVPDNGAVMEEEMILGAGEAGSRKEWKGGDRL